MLSAGGNPPRHARALFLSGVTLLQGTLYVAAASAIEVAIRIFRDPYLNDNRWDALVYAAGAIAVGVAVGIPASGVAGILFARRWGTIAASIWPVVTAAGAWALTQVFHPHLGPRTAGWVALVLAASAAAALVGGISALTPADDLPGRPRERGRWRAPAAAAVIPLVVLGWFGGRIGLDRRSPPAGAPSVLLISVDTLRADALGAFREGKILPPGLARASTPALDDFAAGACVFAETSTVMGKTPQAIASMLTGKYPARHGVLDLASALEPSNVTLAEVLRENGWATSGVVTNLLVGRQTGMAQGFDAYHEKDGLRPPFKRLALVDLALRLAPWPGRWLLDRFPVLRIGKENAPETTARALAALSRVAGKPYFLWVHYLDPHWTYWPPEPWRSQSDTRPGEPFTLYEDVRAGRPPIGDLIHRNTMSPEQIERVNALYAGEVSFVDSEISRLIDAALGAPGGDSTLVVITSDHGESLGEHGYFYSHGDLVHEPGMRIPMIIRLPGGGDGRRFKTPASIVDILPTVLDLAGMGIPSGVQGISLAGLMAGRVGPGDPALERPIFGESDLSYLKEDPYLTVPGEAGKIRSVRIGPWKLVRIPHDVEKAKKFDPDLGSGGLGAVSVAGLGEATRLLPSRPDAIALYNIDTDPGEAIDLSAAEPARTAAMIEILDRWLASTIRVGARARAGREGLVEGLESLGYVDRGGGVP